MQSLTTGCCDIILPTYSISSDFSLIVSGLTVFFISHHGFAILKEYETLALDKDLLAGIATEVEAEPEATSLQEDNNKKKS